MNGKLARFKAEHGHNVRRTCWPEGIWVVGRYNLMTQSNVATMCLEGKSEVVATVMHPFWERDLCGDWSTDDWQIAERNGRWMDHEPVDTGWIGSQLRHGQKLRSPRWEPGAYIQTDGLYDFAKRGWTIKAYGSDEFIAMVHVDPFFLIHELMLDDARNVPWEIFR